MATHWFVPPVLVKTETKVLGVNGARRVIINRNMGFDEKIKTVPTGDRNAGTGMSVSKADGRKRIRCGGTLGHVPALDYCL